MSSKKSSLKVNEWIATGLLILAAILLATKYVLLAYPMFMLANIAWIIFAVRVKQYGLLVTNIVSLIISILGFSNWIYGS